MAMITMMIFAIPCRLAIAIPIAAVNGPPAAPKPAFVMVEAVFKALNLNGNAIRLNEIEILENENGQPQVTLHGKAEQLAKEKKITTIMISLSYDTDYAVAYAAAECAPH